jgi:aspartyl-tRNA(Asn)/glutamyl-tRNA(Gln) amidotransferase subunit C
MPLDRENVRAIAQLARLKVPEAALDSLAGELNNILGWVEQLGEVDTDGVAPMTSVVATTLLQREDIVDDGDMVEDVLANAPEEARNFFVVPKVIE